MNRPKSDLQVLHLVANNPNSPYRESALRLLKLAEVIEKHPLFAKAQLQSQMFGLSIWFPMHRKQFTVDWLRGIYKICTPKQESEWEVECIDILDDNAVEETLFNLVKQHGIDETD